MQVENYIDNIDFIQMIKQYIENFPKTMNMFRKHDYVSISGLYKKTELLFCIYCSKLIIILKEKHIDFVKYGDIILSIYLNYFFSGWKIACNMNISDDDMMIVLKDEKEPYKFYNKLIDQLGM